MRTSADFIFQLCIVVVLIGLIVPLSIHAWGEALHSVTMHEECER